MTHNYFTKLVKVLHLIFFSLYVNQKKKDVHYTQEKMVYTKLTPFPS